MKIKYDDVRTKMIDWFIITRIRILNFIKEHKYLSATIGTFLISCIAILIVYASSDYDGKIKSEISVAQKGISTVEEITQINSFSTIVYDMTYKLSLIDEEMPEGGLIRDSVIIEASFKEDVDAQWQTFSDEVSDYKVSDDKKTVTVTLYNIEVTKEIKQQLYLKVNNVIAGKQINVDIKMKESTSDYSNVVSKTVTVNNTTTIDSLSYRVVGSKAYKSEKLTNGKIAPFGIIIGIDKGTLNSLEGVYFDNTANLSLASKDSYGNQLDILTDNGTYGVYNSSLNYINNMPTNIYDSGVVNSLNKETKTTTETISATISLEGSNEVNLNVGEVYTEYGIKVDGNITCKVSDTVCTRAILYKENESTAEVLVDNIDTSKQGVYTITYTYGTKILTRNVNVSDSKQNVQYTHTEDEQEKTYTFILNGNDEVVLPLGSTYSIEGVLKKESQDSTYSSSNIDYSISVKKKGIFGTYGKVDISDNSINDKGEYRITYSILGILDSDGNTIIDLEGKKLDLIRNVKIIENDSETININKEKNESIYNLSISNIKSNGELNLYDDDFIALGMYYVNVKSPRAAGDKSDITVTLNVGDKSATSLNEYYSVGTKTNELNFYSSEYGTLKKLTPEEQNNYLAYGEEVILKSDLNYLADGDDEISTVSNTITLKQNDGNMPFSFLSYHSDVETELEFYLAINGKRVVSQNEDGNLKYSNKTDETGTPLYETISELESFNIDLRLTEENILEEITYNATNVKPGTSIELRVRLKTNAKIEGREAVATSSSKYVQLEEESTGFSTASVNITAFKARTSLLINDLNYDVIINGASESEQISKWTIYPSITMPIEQVTTSAVGFDTIKTIKIDVVLPKGINYIYNELYDIPIVSNVSDGITRLTYTLNDKKVNEWIEPILFETDFDVDIPSGSNLAVSAVITATSTTDVSDLSSEVLRTSKRTITYQNNEEIATTMHTEYNSISKQTPFTVETQIYNNSGKNYSNLELITILPLNDASQKSDFDGSYKISDIPMGAMCTSYPNITKENISSKEIVWENCSDIEEPKYEEVTAFKQINISLSESARSFKNKVTISPIGNKTDNYYAIKSYLVVDNENKIIDIPSVTISVISKKITGSAWEDFDHNGLFDDNEKKLDGVILKLYNSDTNELIRETSTDIKGNYTLTDISEGTYYIIAEYNTVKYGLPVRRDDISDKSKKNSFTSVIAGSYDEEDEEDDQENTIIRTIEDIIITDRTKTISNINIGPTLNQVYELSLKKYVTKAITTNNTGFVTTKDFGNALIAKLDVKDIYNLNIKVVYTIELENVGFYPGYIYKVRDYVPDGMKFNPEYEENKGWIESENGYVENTTLSEELLYAGDKKYLTIAFDITRKEAGSFKNYATVEDEDIQILVIGKTLEEGVE